jgi:hypothetical protein
VGLLGHHLRGDRVSRLAAIAKLSAQAVDLAAERADQLRQRPLERVDPLEDPPRGGQGFLAGRVGVTLGVVANLASARLRRLDDRPDLLGDDRTGPIGRLGELLATPAAAREWVELAVNGSPSGPGRW